MAICSCPGCFSNAADAPHLGEAAILFNLTRLPAEGVPVKTGGSMPGFVLIWLALQFGFGLILLAIAIKSFRQWRKHGASMVFHRPEIQFGIWTGLMVACAFCLFFGQTFIALLCLVCAQLFPREQRKKMPSPDSKSKSAARD